VFAPFLELIRSDTQTGEIVLKLDAWPLNERFLRLSFDGMDMKRSAGVSIKEHTLAEARLSAQLKTIRELLFAIAVIMGLILLHFVFRQVAVVGAGWSRAAR
jgi:hypothetical protein